MVSHVVYNRGYTEDVYCALNRELADLASRRQVDQIQGRANKVLASNSNHFRNLGGALLLKNRLAAHSLQQLAAYFWNQEDLRAALLRQIDDSPAKS